VDNAKGVLVLLYIILHIFTMPSTAYTPPGWLAHGGDIVGVPFFSFLNFSFMDLGPTSFYFFIGLTVFKSFSKKVAAMGKKAAYAKSLSRNAILFGISQTILFVKSKILGETFEWDSITSIAFTGVILLAFMSDFIRERAWVRLSIGAAILILYNYFKPALELLSAGNGGIKGCIGYTGVVLIASALGDFAQGSGEQTTKFFTKNMIKYLIVSVALFFAAWAAKTFWGEASFKSSDLNGTYMVMATFVMNCIFFLAYILDKLFIKGRPLPIFASFGRNIIVFLYMTFTVDSVLFILPYTYTLTQILIAEAVCVAVYLALAYIFDKKKMVIKL
jgi:hypothetical protein